MPPNLQLDSLGPEPTLLQAQEQAFLVAQVQLVEVPSLGLLQVQVRLLHSAAEVVLVASLEVAVNQRVHYLDKQRHKVIKHRVLRHLQVVSWG